MAELEQIDKLHTRIREKGNEYQKLLNTLQNNPPANTAELFRLKRRLIMISREKSTLIEECRKIRKA